MEGSKGLCSGLKTEIREWRNQSINLFIMQLVQHCPNGSEQNQNSSNEFCLMLNILINNFSVMSWQFPVFLGITSTKQPVKCLAEGHNTYTTVTLLTVSLKLATFDPKSSAFIPTKPLHSAYCNRNCLCQFREITWNQTTVVHRGSTLIMRVIMWCWGYITWRWRHRNHVNTITSVIAAKQTA